MCCTCRCVCWLCGLGRQLSMTLCIWPLQKHARPTATIILCCVCKACWLIGFFLFPMCVLPLRLPLSPDCPLPAEGPAGSQSRQDAR